MAIIYLRGLHCKLLKWQDQARPTAKKPLTFSPRKLLLLSPRMCEQDMLAKCWFMQVGWSGKILRWRIQQLGYNHKRLAHFICGALQSHSKNLSHQRKLTLAAGNIVRNAVAPSLGFCGNAFEWLCLTIAPSEMPLIGAVWRRWGTFSFLETNEQPKTDSS